MGGGPDAHRVTLTKPFWLGRTEVTQAQWKAVMGGNPSHFKGDDRPVETVSWADSIAYCRKLTERERTAGRLPTDYVYTLPTEAQWEYACKAGTTGEYADILDDMVWYLANSGNQTHPVGQKRANAWGLYDMHGNVWEWCLEWSGAYPGGDVTDPSGPSSGSVHICRGGSWRDSASFWRFASRDLGAPVDRSASLGFRICLVAQNKP
jgi:formylglycine-generating enzyme required for sulfatase activity